MKVYAVVGDGLLEIEPEEWADPVAEVAVVRDERASVVVLEEVSEYA